MDSLSVSKNDRIFCDSRFRYYLRIDHPQECILTNVAVAVRIPGLADGASLCNQVRPRLVQFLLGSDFP